MSTEISNFVPNIFQLPQLLQWLHLWQFQFQESSLPSCGMSHYRASMKWLMRTLSTSLALMTCVEMVIHSRGWLSATTHAQYKQHHRKVTCTPSQWQQLAEVETWEDLQVHLYSYKVFRAIELKVHTIEKKINMRLDLWWEPERTWEWLCKQWHSQTRVSASRKHLNIVLL